MKPSSIVAVACLPFLCSLANAATYCVGSDAHLELALFQAHQTAVITNGNSTSEIRLKRRASSYLLTQVPVSAAGQPFGALEIKGGYSDQAQDDCSDQGRSQDSKLTKIVYAPDEAGALSFVVSNHMVIDGLTLESPGGTYIEYDSTDFAKVLVTSTIFSGGGEYALQVERHGQKKGDADFRIVNNRFTGSNGAACAVRLANLFNDEADITADIANNTIASNDGPGVCIKQLEAARFYNNIVWGNGEGIVDQAPNFASKVTLRSNTLQPSTIPGQMGLHPGGLESDPLLDSDYHLLPGSPAVNSGEEGDVPGGGLPAYDLDGNPRFHQDGRVDRGAFESMITDSDHIVVDSPQDKVDLADGATTLREAILIANAGTGPQLVSFAIGDPVICPAVIQLVSALPSIENDITIDGGSSKNTDTRGFNAEICTIIVGPALPHALHVPMNSTVTLSVAGIQFAGFQTAIELEGGSAHTIRGNWFGSNFLANGHGVRAYGSSTSATIGGSDPSQRNFFQFSNTAGVELASNGNSAVGNLIGSLEAPSTTGDSGIRVSGNGNFISGNLIFRHEFAGIDVTGADNVFSANELAANGTGVRISNDGSLLAGQNNTVFGNRIFQNTGAGISLSSGTFGNRLWPLEVRDNGGLAIDLDEDSAVQTNDLDMDPASSAANRGQNFPVLLDAGITNEAGTTAQALGVLESHNGKFYLRFYASAQCDDSGHGEGGEQVGYSSVAIDNASAQANGSIGFSVPLSSASTLGNSYVSATATDSLGNTSEFGPCYFLGGEGIFQDGFE